MHEVWITGAGIVTAIGQGIRAHTHALRASTGGLKRHNFFNGKEPDPCICGIVGSEILPESIDESAHNRADILLRQALDQALVHAGLGRGITADVIAGTTLGNMHGGSRYYNDVRQGNEGDISLVKHFLPGAPLDAVTRELALAGNHLTVCSACASASAALGQAFRRVVSGRCERAIAGGFDALSPFVIAGFNSLRLISSEPCRPFAADRNGLNPGEGAAMLVLESKEAARARGAVPLAKIAGFGEALEAYHYTRADPEGTGIANALGKALLSAQMSPESIDHIHSHGTGTPANDRSEYVAFKKVFGNKLKDIAVCSTKPLTGHAFGAAGAINALFSIISIAEQFIPATLFCENADSEFVDLTLCTKTTAASKLTAIASCALGFGGEASVCIISKVE